MFRATIHKIRNLVVQRPYTDIKDTTKNIIMWGEANDEPLRIVDTVNGSITGRACIDTIKKYVYGMGLNIGTGDEPFKIGGKNVNRLHSELSSQVAKLRGVAIWLGREPDGTIISLKKIPFENCRLGLPDDDGVTKKVFYNPYYGTSEYKEEDTIEYDLFEPDPEKMAEQIRSNGSEWRGSIYYSSITDEFNPFYPSPPWWCSIRKKGGGKKWMEIEQSIGDFHAHNIGKGFLQQVLMKIVGDPDAPIPKDQDKYNNNESYTTVREEFDQYLNDTFAGPEGDKLMALWSRVREDFPEMQAFPASTNHELFQTLQRLTTENILIATQVPPVLAGVKVSGTLSKDDIENSVKIMRSMVEDEQSFLEDIYNELFPLMKDPPDETVKILAYSPVQLTLDPLIWAALTPQEQRQWIVDNTDIEIDVDIAPEPTPEQQPEEEIDEEDELTNKQERPNRAVLS